MSAACGAVLHLFGFPCLQVFRSSRRGPPAGVAFSFLFAPPPPPPLSCLGSGCTASVVDTLCIEMDERNNPRRSRSRSRDIRRVGSCDHCSACAVNRGILLRILHTVQDFQRSTSTRPPTAGSGRPALDLTEVFAGTIDQASIQMAHPRTAALAVRHLESRCDSIVRLLEALDASVNRRSD